MKGKQGVSARMEIGGLQPAGRVGTLLKPAFWRGGDQCSRHLPSKAETTEQLFPRLARRSPSGPERAEGCHVERVAGPGAHSCSMRTFTTEMGDDHAQNPSFCSALRPGSGR